MCLNVDMEGAQEGEKQGNSLYSFKIKELILLLFIYYLLLNYINLLLIINTYFIFRPNAKSY